MFFHICNSQFIIAASGRAILAENIEILRPDKCHIKRQNFQNFKLTTDGNQALKSSKEKMGENLECKIDQILEKFGSLGQTITSLHGKINNIRKEIKAHNEQINQKFRVYTQNVDEKY